MEINETVQKELLNTKKDSFNNGEVLARRMKTEFLSNSVIWLMFKFPGLLDMPLQSVGVQKGEFFTLYNLESTILFYNKDLKKIPTEDDSTRLAIELLKVSYFDEEFGYANNTQKCRGYDVISAIGEIATLTDQDVKFDVSPPTTIKKGNEYLTEMWFWGAHNCELHKFSLTVNGSEIKYYKDEVLGKFGTCHPLAYE
jgi:hypothetical protein